MANPLRSVLYLILLAFCLLPVLPITLSWIETVRGKRKLDSVQIIFLTLVSVSFTWIVLALVSPLMLGPIHSSARHLMISCNFLLMTLVAIAAFIRNKGITGAVLAASVTALVWGYIAIINVPI